MHALERYKKTEGDGSTVASRFDLEDWNGVLDEVGNTLAGLQKKGADFDAIATVAIDILLDRINSVLGPAYDNVALRGQQVDTLYARLNGLGVSADAVTETADRLFLTAVRRAAILSDLIGGAPAGRQTLKALNDAVVANAAALAAITAGADPLFDTFVEVSARLTTDANQLGALMASVAARLRTDIATQGLDPGQKHNARFNAAAAPWDALAYKNIAVNPRHTIQQFSSAAGAGYITDGHAINYSGPVLAGSRVASPFASRPDIAYGMRATVTTAKATLAAGDYTFMYQPIEGVRARRLLMGTANAKNCFVGVMLNFSVAGTYYICLKNGAFNRANYQKVTLAANTDTFVPLIFLGDTAGTWASDASLGLRVDIIIGMGSTRQGTPASAGTWQAGDLEAGADQTNGAATANATFTMSDLIVLDMAPGVVTDPTQVIPAERLPFFQRHDGDELAICQRYYQVFNGLILYRSTAGGNLGGGAGSCAISPMRIAPSVGVTSYIAGTYNAVNIYGSYGSIQWYWQSGSNAGDYTNFNAAADARL